MFAMHPVTSFPEWWSDILMFIKVSTNLKWPPPIFRSTKRSRKDTLNHMPGTFQIIYPYHSKSKEIYPSELHAFCRGQAKHEVL